MKRYLPGVPSKDVRARVWDKWDSRHPYVPLAAYMSLRFYRTRGFLLECDRAGLNTRRNETLLTLVRIEGLWLADKGQGAKSSVFPLCNQPEGGSSLGHLVVGCEEVSKSRVFHLTGLFAIVVELHPSGPDSEWLQLLLGGEISGKALPEWAALAPYSRGDRPGHVPVMSFLGETIPRYREALIRRLDGATPRADGLWARG